MIYLIFSLLVTSVFAKTTYQCDTTFDQLGIPHTKTTSTEGFYYCFGIHHGQDRAWQLDFLKRVAYGRNAEVLGFSQLKSDLMMRLLDIPGLVDKIWKNYPEDKKQLLSIYADGVNEGFKSGKNSHEFKDLGYEPEPWRAQDSLIVLLLQSFDQTRKNFFRDYDEQKSKQIWGDKAGALFDEDNMPWQKTILKEGEYLMAKPLVHNNVKSAPPLKLWHDFPSVFGLETGSNNWVISKEKSKTKHAILANDPHLDLKTPVFWYWINIKTPSYNVVGGSLPGVPIIATGTNGKISWGLTNSYLNSADALFLKDVKAEELETIRPLVKIKFGFLQLPFFFKSFEKLKSGHRVLPLEIESEDKLILRWAGYSLKAEDIYPMFEMFKTQDINEFNKALTDIGIPSWNFVFADTKGEIGYRLVGKTFRHTQKIPMGISEITREDLNREEYFSTEERPHLMRPPRNFIITSNNRHWPPDAAFYGGRAYTASFRAYKIEEMLTGLHDVESFKKIQCDREVMEARFFLPKFAKYLNVPEFQNWSRLSEDASFVLPLYRRFFDLLLEKWEVNEYALFKLLDKLSPNQLSEFKETFKTAQNEVKGKSWGELHVLNFPHMSKNMDWAFSPEIPGIGDTHTVDPGTSKWNSNRQLYEQQSGASMRMIIEMSETPKVILALPGLNRNYDKKADYSPWKSWSNCEYTEIKY
jgi:penicillin amidase